MSPSTVPSMTISPVDFISAMIHSFQAVTTNLLPMLAWALVIAVLMVLAMLPFFLGLFVVLPVLGHATWHLYRRVMRFDDQGLA